MVFRDPSRTVHVLEHAARVDVAYYGIVAACKTPSSPGGVDTTDAGDNRATLAPEQYYMYCTTSGDVNQSVLTKHTETAASIRQWGRDLGLLCLDVVLPFSAAVKKAAPRPRVGKMCTCTSTRATCTSWSATSSQRPSSGHSGSR